jgi:hypothetical protein
MIAEIILMIRQNQNPTLVAERLCTYLPPHMRRDLRRGMHFSAPMPASFMELEKTQLADDVARLKKKKVS